MSHSATTVRAEQPLLGTLFLSVAAIAITAVEAVPRADAQQPTQKAKGQDDTSPSDNPPGKEKAKSATVPLPAGAIRRLGSPPGPTAETVGHTGGVQSLSFSPDGRRLASRGDGELVGRICLWDVATGNLERKLNGDELAMFSPDGKLVLSQSSADDKEDEVVLWDSQTGEVRGRVPAAELKFARMLPGGKECVIVYGRNQAAYVDLVTSKIKRTVLSQWGTPLCLSRDGSRVACVRGDNNNPDTDTRIHLGDVATGNDALAVFDGKKGKVLSGAGVGDFSPEPLAAENRLVDERLLAVGGYDSTVHVWDLRSPTRALWALRGHTARVLRVAFSPDGRFVVSSGLDGTIRIWDVTRPRPNPEDRPIPLGEVAQVRGHNEYATSLAFSPDGRWLASGGNFRDRTIVLWDFWKLVLGENDAPLPVTDARLQALWNDLASDAAGGGPLAAVGALAAVPADATRFVQRQLDPYVQEAQKDRILELIAQLDAGQYAVREAATEALIRLRRQAEGILRSALRETHSPEAHFRLRRILSQGNAAPSLSAAEVRRYRRTVLLLERVGSPESQKLLEHLSDVFPSPDVNRDAREALARLRAKAGS
jgi:WD40 repeat protein